MASFDQSYRETVQRDYQGGLMEGRGLTSKDMMREFQKNYNSNSNTIKKDINDTEIDAMKDLQMRRRIMDDNTYLRKRYSTLETDLYYYQNQFDRTLRNLGKENNEAAENEEIQKLRNEKDQLCKILTKTMTENEDLQSKAEGIALTQLVAPVLISKLLGDDPAERCEEAIKECNHLKEQIASEKAELDLMRSERDKWKKLFEESNSETKAKILAEKQHRLNMRTDLEKNADKNLKGTLDAQVKQFQRKEENYNESISKLRDYSDKQKAVNEEIIQENLDLKKTIDDREKLIGELELKNMRLQNDLVSFDSNLDLAKTERDINLDAKKNLNKQIELMNRQMQEMRSNMDDTAERMAEYKYEIDMMKREKEYAHEKMVTMQDNIKSLTADRDGLENLK